MQVSRPTLNQRELPRKHRDSVLGPRYFLLGRKPKSAGQKASLFPSTSASGSRKCSSVLQGRCTRLLASASGVPPAAMAAAAAAGGPGAPLSPDELLPKGDSEKTEEELEEEDDEEVLGPCGVRRGARLRPGNGPPGGVSSACCGIRTKARRGARRGRRGGVFSGRRG